MTPFPKYRTEDENKSTLLTTYTPAWSAPRRCLLSQRKSEEKKASYTRCLYSNRFAPLSLKNSTKVHLISRGTDCKIGDHFYLLHWISVSVSVSVSLVDEDIFKANSLSWRTFKADKNWGENFPFFKKLLFLWMIFISAKSSFLDEFKYTIFIPVTWPDETQQSKMSR